MMQIFLLSLPAPHAHGLAVSYDRIFFDGQDSETRVNFENNS